MATCLLVLILSITLTKALENDTEAKVCGEKPCVVKCCPFNQILNYNGTCEETGHNVNYFNFSVYDSSMSLSKKKVNKDIELLPRENYNLSSFNIPIKILASEHWLFNMYIMEDGLGYVERINVLNRWIKREPQSYCIEYQEMPDNPTPVPVFCVEMFDIDIAEEENDSEEWNTVVSVGILFSSICLLVVLAVYIVLPELRNLGGMILMAYAASLHISYVFLFCLRMYILQEELESLVCYGLSFMVYFSLLASFFWMNIMSFDIWWTFRNFKELRHQMFHYQTLRVDADLCTPLTLYHIGIIAFTNLINFLSPAAREPVTQFDYLSTIAVQWLELGYAKARPIHRRGEKFKFFMYSLYGFGVPLLMTIAVICLFNADLSYIPWFVTPDFGCFFTDDVKMLYLYTPMLILIMCNWLFFLLTAYNVWRLSRNTAVLSASRTGRSSDHQNQRNRFMVYIKLCAVMGISWVLEVLCYFVPSLNYLQIQDLYHSLIGLVIMLIFVCKRKIFKKLAYKFHNVKHPKWASYSKRTSISTSDSDISQDTPLKVCSDPTGFDYRTPTYKNTY